MAQAPSSDATFRRVFDAHFEAIHRYCLRRLDTDDANDATAEVFMVAWRRIADLPSGEESLPWLYGVARNVVSNQRRSSRRKVRLVSRLGSIAEPPVDPPDLQVVQHSEVVEMHEALQKLRPKDQELVRLKAWEELSNQQIGQILGISDRAVEGRYARALRKLGKSLTTGSNLASRLVEEGGAL